MKLPQKLYNSVLRSFLVLDTLSCEINCRDNLENMIFKKNLLKINVIDVQCDAIKKYRNEASIMKSLLSFSDQLFVIFHISLN